jgi:hypothetical protein
MAGKVVVSTLNDDTGVLATQNGITGIAKAWVNFNGTGTVAIRGSFNVSSITDNGTGNYTVNFTTAMPNANYSGIASCGLGTAANFGTISLGTFSTTQFNFGTGYISGGNVAQDNNFVTVAVFSS